jgi:hypothetical protein
VRLAVWHVREDGPVRIPASALQLEQELEAWIERDPSLAVEGLDVVGRQVTLEGGRLDLLGVDPQGLWTVVEIKRGQLYRDTVAQALDYASSVSTMPSEKLREIVGETSAGRSPVQEALAGTEGERRDVRVVVVGTGRDSSLDRIVHFLGDGYDIPIQVVTFEVFAVEPEGRILIREVTEADPSTPVRAAAAPFKLEEVFAIAKTHGTAEAFETIHAFAEEQGLYARPWKWSIMYTPPSARNRTLMTVWTKQDGELRIYVAPASVFAEFFAISEEGAQRVLGSDEWHILSGREQAEAFTARLMPLLMRSDEQA